MKGKSICFSNLIYNNLNCKLSVCVHAVYKIFCHGLVRFVLFFYLKRFSFCRLRATLCDKGYFLKQSCAVSVITYLMYLFTMQVLNMVAFYFT